LVKGIVQTKRAIEVADKPHASGIRLLLRSGGWRRFIFGVSKYERNIRLVL
jgi:hypothetical protein